MRASLMTRAGSVAAAAVIATTGAIATAGAASASTAHHKRIATHLSIAKRRAVVHHKHVTFIGGRLSTVHHNIGLKGRLVFLERVTANHKLVKVNHERTRKHGWVAFVVDPKATTKFVLVFEGTPLLHSSRSHVVAVKG
jgi:hypothetical protein